MKCHVELVLLVGWWWLGLEMRGEVVSGYLYGCGLRVFGMFGDGMDGVAFVVSVGRIFDSEPGL